MYESANACTAVNSGGRGIRRSLHYDTVGSLNPYFVEALLMIRLTDIESFVFVLRCLVRRDAL